MIPAIVPESTPDSPLALGAASVVYHGPFQGLEEAVLALLGWIAACSRVPNGPVRELHLTSPAHAADHDEAKHVIELQIPVRMVAEEAE